jgi:DtxR family transcriptional regulator, Mn-dependent transcriptional regulator
MNSVSEKRAASLEDYLEGIAVLKEQGGKVTVTALSKSVGVDMPSVCWALKRLSGAGLVIHERYGDVDLTLAGARVADEVCRGHKALFSFLTDVLMIDPEIAEQGACSMEHALSRDSIHRLEEFISLVMECYPGRPDRKDTFNRYVEQGRDEGIVQARCHHE